MKVENHVLKRELTSASIRKLRRSVVTRPRSSSTSDSYSTNTQIRNLYDRFQDGTVFRMHPSCKISVYVSKLVVRTFLRFWSSPAVATSADIWIGHRSMYFFVGSSTSASTSPH